MSIELRPLEYQERVKVRTLLAAACAHDPAAAVAEEKIFGDAPGEPTARIGAYQEDALLGLAVASARWIRILAVAPAARGRGVGTALLAAAEAALARGGATAARTMDQPGNYLAPGVAVENRETITWLERRGYRRAEENTNLLVDLVDNPMVSGARASALITRAAEEGYQVRRALEDDRDTVATQVERAFGRAWGFEVERALEIDAVHVALEGGELAAFAAHDGNNRGLGWFGPAGTLEPHRKRGLGEALYLACLRDLAAAGHPTCTVAWIGPRAFYQRCAGIAGECRYLVLTKELTK